MKTRLKFTKLGSVKFVGHLDTMRLFQRAIKVAGIPIAYSQGFNPHSLVYFAMPLSVGVSSTGEYMDVVTKEDIQPDRIKEALNAVLVDGIQIIDAFRTDEPSASLMSLVDAASYELTLPKEKFEGLSIQSLEDRLNKRELLVEKKGKKGVKTVDIKPMVLTCNIAETKTHFIIELQVLAGSRENLSPHLFLEAVIGVGGSEVYDIIVIRKELYTYAQNAYIALDCYGRNS